MMRSTTKKAHPMMSRPIQQNEAVQVVVRCRPMSDKEISRKCIRVVDADPTRGTIVITNPNPNLDPNEARKTFTFDAVFDWDSTQEDVYETVRPLVSCVLSGFNGTIFAYGQTGTGKTHTMEGSFRDPQNRGIILRSFDQIFSHIGRSVNQQFIVQASYLEIYQEEIRDLLASAGDDSRCEIHERSDCGVYIKGIKTVMCQNSYEIGYVMASGNQCRSTGTTNMNEHSSRSHAILTVTIEMADLELSAGDKKCIRVGKLNLVDLAGSERQGKSGATGERLKEAAKINLSLSALGNVISALVDGRTSHIPYRDSKLTRLLQDSLGGNSKTIMVANIGPANYNYEESLTTLRYANRAKNIKNKPRVNEDPKDALIRKYREEIAQLKAELKEKQELRSLKQSEFKSNALEQQDNRMSTDLSDSENIKEPDGFEENRSVSIEDKRSTDDLEKQIAAIESKVLSGGKNIVDRTNEQQRNLELHNQQIAEKKRREVEMCQKLELQEDTAIEIHSTYLNLQQEVDCKTKKLKKLFSKLQSVKQEIHDITEEFNRDRRELELAQNEALRELKAKYMLIDNFIPVEEKSKLLQRLYYCEAQDDWVVKPLATDSELTVVQRPGTLGERRPVSDYARVAQKISHHSRYQGENFLSPSPDPHLRSTIDYEVPTIAPKIQAVLDQALRVEDDLDIDASQLTQSFFIDEKEKYKSNTRASAKVVKKVARGSSGIACTKQATRRTLNKGEALGSSNGGSICDHPPGPSRFLRDNPVYPIARGLVPKK